MHPSPSTRSSSPGPRARDERRAPLARTARIAGRIRPWVAAPLDAGAAVPFAVVLAAFSRDPGSRSPLLRVRLRRPRSVARPNRNKHYAGRSPSDGQGWGGGWGGGGGGGGGGVAPPPPVATLAPARTICLEEAQVTSGTAASHGAARRIDLVLGRPRRTHASILRRRDVGGDLVARWLALIVRGFDPWPRLLEVFASSRRPALGSLLGWRGLTTGKASVVEARPDGIPRRVPSWSADRIDVLAPRP